MKRLIILIISLCLFSVLGAQEIKRANPFARAQVSAGGGGLGEDILLNGDAHDGNDWELPGDPAYTTITGGVFSVNGAAWDTFMAQGTYQNAGMSVINEGETWRVTFDIKSRTSGNFYIRLNGTEDTDHIWSSVADNNTTDIVAGSGGDQLAFISYSAGFVGTIDNIKLQKVN